MPADRDIAITYAGLAIGGSSAVYKPDARNGRWTLRKSYGVGRFEFRVLVTAKAGMTAAAFRTNCLALEAAFRKPRQDLTVVVDGSTFISWSHANGTGFNARPDCAKLGDEVDTALSREYLCSVEVDLPADLSGMDFRRESEVDVAYDESRIRTVTISATYTCNGTTGARAQYEASISAYAALVQTALSISNWQRIQEPTTREVDGSPDGTAFVAKLIRVTVVYRELIYGASSGLQAAGVVNFQLDIDRSRIAPGDYGADVRRLIDIPVTWRCSVDSTITTDLPTLWSSTILPFIASEVSSSLGANGYSTLVREVRQLDPANNRIRAQLLFRAVGSNGVVTRRLTRRYQVTPGNLVIGLHSGNTFDAHPMAGPGTWRVITRLQQTSIMTTSSVVMGSTTSLSSVPTLQGLPPGSFRFPSWVFGQIGGNGISSGTVSVPDIGVTVSYDKEEEESTQGLDGGLTTLREDVTETVRWITSPDKGGLKFNQMPGSIGQTPPTPVGGATTGQVP